MKNWFGNNFWIKVVSLILAVATWFYVKIELAKERQASSRFYSIEQSDYFRKAPGMEMKMKDSKKDMNKGYIQEKE